MNTSTQLVAALTALVDDEGYLNPAKVVEEARPETSILHEYIFRETDGEAAQAWRLQRATQLIRRLRVHVVSLRRSPREIDVEVVRIERQPRQIRFAQAPRSGRGREGGYRLTAEVVNDDALNGDMVDTLRSELLAFLRRAQDYVDAQGASGRVDPTLQTVVGSIAEIVTEAWPNEPLFDGRGDSVDEGAVA